MYYYLLLALLSINAWAMKRVDTYSEVKEVDTYGEVKEEIIKTQEGKDPFNNSIGYADTIFIKHQNKYVACHVTSLYERLCEKAEKKKDDKYRYLYSGKKINDVYEFFYKNDEITSEKYKNDEITSENTLETGLEITSEQENMIKLEITPEQENMIKFYYQSLPLAKNMTREEIDSTVSSLFELYLNNTKLTEKELGFLKRFLRYEHLPLKLFPYLHYNNQEVVKITKPKLEELEGKWSLRRSFTYENDNKNLSYCIVFFYILLKELRQSELRQSELRQSELRQSELRQSRVFYQSGMGFYVMVSKDKRDYYTNLIDVLDKLLNDKKITKNNYIKGL